MSVTCLSIAAALLACSTVVLLLMLVGVIAAAGDICREAVLCSAAWLAKHGV
jgi:hypothetical protein